jgi:hypothetical protein
MARRIELEGPLAQIQAPQLGAQMRRLDARDTDTGQHPRQFLDIMLGISGVDAQGVQLHELAGVVLVDVPCCILRIVQILQHGRVLQRRHDEVTEVTERVWPDRPIGIVRQHPAHIGLLLEDTEMVEPEPDHLLFELVGGIDRAQQLTAPRLVSSLIALFVELLPRGLLLRPLRQGVDALLLDGDAHKEVFGINVVNRQLRELARHGVRQMLIGGP